MQKQQLEMQMNMQMNMMKETKQMEIQAQMDLRKYEEEKRKEEREERAREREEEKQRYQEILSTLNQSRVPDRDFERDEKILNPPSWTKLESFSAYKSNFQAWHKTYVTAKPFKKNQLLLDSLKSNTDYEGLNQFIVNEIIENPEIKKESDIVDNILQKVEEFAKESPWKINADLVRYFFNFEQEKDETSKKYILKFELLESKLRNHKVGISNMFLANMLIYRSSLTDLERKNVLSRCRLEDNENILKDLKRNFRELNANSTKDEKGEEVKITLYGNYERGRAFNRHDERKSRYRSRSQGKPYHHRSGSRSKTPKRRSFSQGRPENSEKEKYSPYKNPERRVYKCSKYNYDGEKDIFDNYTTNIV